MGFKGLPIFEFKIDKNKKEDGVKLISIVDKPAIQSNFYMFADEEKQKYNFVDEPKKMIAGLALIPNKYIYRANAESEFYGFFSADTIEMIRNKFMKEKNIDQVNFMHVEQAQAENIYLVESYIVNNKFQQQDLKEKGIEAPIGSWFVQYHVEDLETFNQIKDLGFHGFSVEAYLEQELVQLNQNKNKTIMSKIIEKFKAVLQEMEAEMQENLVDKIAETGQEVKVGKEGEAVSIITVDPMGQPTESPCPDGQYVLENGDTIECKAGLLVTRMPKVEAACDPKKDEMGLVVGDVKPNDVAEPVKETSGSTTPAVSGETKMAEVPSGSTEVVIPMPEVSVDVSSKTLGEIVGSQDGEFDIYVKVEGGKIVSAEVETYQDLTAVHLAEQVQKQNKITELEAEIVALKAQLKLPVTKPITDTVKPVLLQSDLAKMTPYERLAMQKGLRIIQ